MLAIAYRDVDVPSQSDVTHLDQEALEQNMTLQAMVGIQVSCFLDLIAAIELKCMAIAHLCCDALVNISYGASSRPNWHRKVGTCHPHHSNACHKVTSVLVQIADRF